MRAVLPLLLIAAPAAAQVRAIPAQPANEREALRGVEVILINEGAAPVPAEGPRQIEVTAADGTRLVLERLPAPAAAVPPGGFVKARYVPTAYAMRPGPPPAPGKPAKSASTVGSAYAGDLPPPAPRPKRSPHAAAPPAFSTASPRTSRSTARLAWLMPAPSSS
jgi:hypothetical protein